MFIYVGKFILVTQIINKNKTSIMSLILNRISLENFFSFRCLIHIKTRRNLLKQLYVRTTSSCLFLCYFTSLYMWYQSISFLHIFLIVSHSHTCLTLTELKNVFAIPIIIWLVSLLFVVRFFFLFSGWYYINNKCHCFTYDMLLFLEELRSSFFSVLFLICYQIIIVIYNHRSLVKLFLFITVTFNY